MSLIDAHAMSVRLGAHLALSHVDFAIERGEIVTIVGPNGSGKTTFIRAMIGAQTAHSGTITRAPNLKIGYVPQGLMLDPTLPMTVARFMNLPHRRTASEITAALVRTGAQGLEARQMSALSGGQFQRVLLARAILGAPDLLVLDEPTTGLDQPAAADFYTQIETLRQELNCAVLMVSHDLHVVMSTSDRVICLNGHICCQGRPEIVVDAPEYRALFGHGTHGALALYRHDHDHRHDETQSTCHEDHDA